MTEIFRLFDADTGDGLAIERDADRLLVTLSIASREHVLVLADGRRVGERIAEALRSALSAPPGRDITRVPRRETL